MNSLFRNVNFLCSPLEQFLNCDMHSCMARSLFLYLWKVWSSNYINHELHYRLNHVIHVEVGEQGGRGGIRVLTDQLLFHLPCLFSIKNEIDTFFLIFSIFCVCCSDNTGSVCTQRCLLNYDTLSPLDDVHMCMCTRA